MNDLCLRVEGCDGADVAHRLAGYLRGLGVGFLQIPGEPLHEHFLEDGGGDDEGENGDQDQGQAPLQNEARGAGDHHERRVLDDHGDAVSDGGAHVVGVERKAGG